MLGLSSRPHALRGNRDLRVSLLQRPPSRDEEHRVVRCFSGSNLHICERRKRMAVSLVQIDMAFLHYTTYLLRMDKKLKRLPRTSSPSSWEKENLMPLRTKPKSEGPNFGSLNLTTPSELERREACCSSIWNCREEKRQLLSCMQPNHL